MSTDSSFDNIPAEGHQRPSDPTTKYPRISPPQQHQHQSGLDSKPEPLADLGEGSYSGSGKLTAHRALITGGDSGLGAAVAMAFARGGADVAMAYLPSEEPDAQRVAGIIRNAGRAVYLFPGDLLEANYRNGLVRDAATAPGGLDRLVNNAGKQVSVENLQAERRTTPGDLSSEYPVDVYPEQGSPELPQARGEHHRHNVDPGLRSFTAPAGLRIHEGRNQQFHQVARCPTGPAGHSGQCRGTRPDLDALLPSSGQPIEALPEFGHNTPLGRAGQPAELAPGYAFLASADSSYVIGETFNVNGGKASP